MSELGLIWRNYIMYWLILRSLLETDTYDDYDTASSYSIHECIPHIGSAVTSRILCAMIIPIFAVTVLSQINCTRPM